MRENTTRTSCTCLLTSLFDSGIKYDMFFGQGVLAGVSVGGEAEENRVFLRNEPKLTLLKYGLSIYTSVIYMTSED